MSEPGASPRRRKFWRYLLFAGLALIVVFGAAAWYVTTESFQGMVRRRVVAELERVTGARVELASIHTEPFRFQVEVRDLTLHGAEPAGAVPYAHVDRLVAQVKIISALGFEFGFNSLIVEHPVIDIVVFPDGKTNQPVPLRRDSVRKNPVEQLFALSIDHLDVRHGELIWNNQRIPLDFVVHDVSADMSYSLLHNRYDTNVLLGKVDTKFKNDRPFAWTVEAHFGLEKSSVDLKSLRATSGRSRLEASGRVSDFLHPAITATYTVSLDLAEAGSIARLAELRRGTLQVEGRGSWSAQDFSSSGKLQVRDLDLQQDDAAVRNVSLAAQYDVTPGKAQLSQVQAHLLGGGASGDVTIANWLNSQSAAKEGKGKKSTEQVGDIRLQLKSISMSELAAALSTRARPFSRLNLAGSLGGKMQSHWQGVPGKAETAIALDIAAPAQPLPHQLPLKAHLQATYRSFTDELEVADFSAQTRATQVHAAGRLSSSNGLKLSVTTGDLGEWEPVLVAAGYGESIPVTLHGHAAFTGTATGTLSALTLAGNLQCQEFDLLIPATARSPEKLVHWDSLAANVQLSPQILAVHKAALRHGETTIAFDLSANLLHRRFVDSSTFVARVEVHRADVAELQSLAGYEYPITGTLDFAVQASGSKALPTGEGRVHLTNGTVQGQAVQFLDSRVSFSNGQLFFNNIEIAQGEARITGAGTYTPAERTFRVNLTGSNFDLSLLPHLHTLQMPVEGRMDFSAQIWGTPGEPAIDAKIHIRDLTLDHERAGDFDVDAVTERSDLHLTGRSQFEHAQLALDGHVDLRGDWSSRINLHFNHLDIDSLLRTYLRGRVTGHSAVAGDLELQGPLRDPRQLSALANLSDFYADLENIKVRNDGPVKFAISSQVFKIDSFHLVGEGTDVTASGSVQLTGDHGLDFGAQGRMSLKLIQSYNPDFTSSGDVAVNVTVSGNMARPVLQGRVQITDGNIAYIDLPSALSGINGSLVFNQNRLQVETLTAHVGGGLVTFNGYVTTYNRQLNFDLMLQQQDVRLRYPPGVSSTTNAELRFAGSSATSTLSGDITVTKLAITPGFDFGAYLERSAQTSSLPQTNPLLNRIRMDVHIVTLPELQMQTAVVRLSGDADLRLRGTAAKPVLLGRADVIEGDVYFNGTKYRLERGEVTFSNPVTTSPVLDLQASTRVRDYDITLNLNGEVDKLNMTYHSEPPLPTADIIALLALGRTTEESAQMQQAGQSPFTQDASSAILSEALNATVSNRVQRLFGVSRIKIDPQGLTTETNPSHGPQVTIEQQVANNFTVTYSTNVSQASQQIIQVEYNLTRNVSIVGVRDQNGVVSFDVRVRQRKK